MPKPQKNDVLSSLRAIVDAGGPQTPVPSHFGDPGGLSKPGIHDTPMPIGEGILGAGSGFSGLLNKMTGGALDDTASLAGMGPLGTGPKQLQMFEHIAPLPSETRMGELLHKFGGKMGSEAPLAMDEASRMERASAQGYTHDVYHGTNKNFPEFQDAIREGSYGTGDFGIHVSSDPMAANSRTNAMTNSDSDIYDSERGAQVMPLKAQMNKTLQLPDMGIWKNPSNYVRKYEDALADKPLHYKDSSSIREHISDAEFMGQVAEEADKLKRFQGPDFNDANKMTLWQHKFREMLQDAGYDSIKYANNVESDGAPSYLLLDPRQVRSRFAAFDPKRANSRDLLASLAAAMGTGAAVSHDPQE